MPNQTYDFHFTSDTTSKMSNGSVTIVPTEDLKDYARFMMGRLIELNLRVPTDDVWKTLVLDSDSASNSIDFAHRITKVVNLVNEYVLVGSLSKIEYNFIDKTHQFLKEYELKNGKPISSM